MDFSDPSSPALSKTVELPHRIHSVVVEGDEVICHLQYGVERFSLTE